jgi:hypothetical protein
MEKVTIPHALQQEIERRASQFGDRYEDAPVSAKSASIRTYEVCAKYWVMRMLAEREATEKALTQLREASSMKNLEIICPRNCRQ